MSDISMKVSLPELANALGIAVQSRIISIEQGSYIFKTYLRNNGLLPEAVKPTLIPKKKTGE